MLQLLEADTRSAQRESSLNAISLGDVKVPYETASDYHFNSRTSIVISITSSFTKLRNAFSHNAHFFIMLCRLRFVFYFWFSLSSMIRSSWLEDEFLFSRISRTVQFDRSVSIGFLDHLEFFQREASFLSARSCFRSLLAVSSSEWLQKGKCQQWVTFLRVYITHA